MTIRQVYEAVLTELNKVKTSTILLKDFNYFFAKAVYQNRNKLYNQYDTTQQTTDDGSNFSQSATLIPKGNMAYLPEDYYHLLNCVCEFTVFGGKCDIDNNSVQYGARRLTADMYPAIINNYYFSPSFNRPYYYIHNSKSEDSIERNNDFNGDYRVGIFNYKAKTLIPFDGYLNLTFTKSQDKYIVKGVYTVGNIEYKIDGIAQETPDNYLYGDITFQVDEHTTEVITLDDFSISTATISNFNRIDKKIGHRYGNPSPPLIEIRYGKNKKYSLSKIHIDYLKTPQHVELTQEQLDAVEDFSQILEFPDYIIYEIINELVKLFLQNISDIRLQTFMPVNQSIATTQQ